MAQYSGERLGLNKRALPHGIVEVVSALQRAGFCAYIVGGGVRDSLLGLTPKDFDAVTDAHPSQIKEVFGGRCRVIGRRFQLAHVYSGREMIEVATFRAPPTGKAHATDNGMIVRDNVWGDIHQDFARRDFSINALYYDPIADCVHDFCDALDDIKNKRLRLLGKSAVRIEEDPVRLLRALRFKAKLGFDFDKALAKQFCPKNWKLLRQVSAHRLYDESQKMFTGGYLSALLPLLYQYGAMPSLVDRPQKTPSLLAMRVAQNTDERINGDQRANPAFFYAALLWDEYLRRLAKLQKKLPEPQAQAKAATRTLEAQRVYTAVPRFAEDFISHVWQLQSQLVAPAPADVERLAKHPRFRAAYDFLVAREAVDDARLSSTNGMGQWWTEYQLFDAKGRKKLTESLGGRDKKRRRGKQNHAEWEQIQRLGLGASAKGAAKPLFETCAQTQTRPKPSKTPEQPCFDQKEYNDAYFARLLAEEPYIPAFRSFCAPKDKAKNKPSRASK